MNRHPALTEEFQITYALSKKVPDMQQRGVRIETSYGELELNCADSAEVAALIERQLERRLAKIRGGAQ